MIQKHTISRDDSIYEAWPDVALTASDDRGRTWTPKRQLAEATHGLPVFWNCARILPIDFDRSPVSDTGYSGWVQFEDGEIYIVNYIVDDAPNGQIRGYSLHLTDFLITAEGSDPAAGTG